MPVGGKIKWDNNGNHFLNHVCHNKKGRRSDLIGRAGWFLANDGINLLWRPVLQMPDPTGSTNQYPVTNGSGYTLVNIPQIPT
jgi:hypothetical protein